MYFIFRFMGDEDGSWSLPSFLSQPLVTRMDVFSKTPSSTTIISTNISFSSSIFFLNLLLAVIHVVTHAHTYTQMNEGSSSSSSMPIIITYRLPHTHAQHEVIALPHIIQHNVRITNIKCNGYPSSAVYARQQQQQKKHFVTLIYGVKILFPIGDPFLSPQKKTIMWRTSINNRKKTLVL